MLTRATSSGRGVSSAHCGVLAMCTFLLVVGAGSAREVEHRFEHGEVVATEYVGEAQIVRQLANGGAGRALAQGDFDEDGVPDLAVLVSTSSGGVLAVHRGNVDAIFPNSPAAKAKRAVRNMTVAKFVAPARVHATVADADLLVAGDFNADGHLDLLVATIGRDEMVLHLGDGLGSFAPPALVRLPGELTALTSGEVNRRDGLADVVAAVRTPFGSQLLIFENPSGALAEPPSVVDLEMVATDLYLGELDGLSGVDLAILARPDVFILHGNNRRHSDEPAMSTVASPIRLPFPVATMVIGDFVSGNSSHRELAVLSGEGVVHLVNYTGRKEGVKNRSVETVNDHDWMPLEAQNWWLSREIASLEPTPLAVGGGGFLSARFVGASTGDLVVVDTDGGSLHFLKAAKSVKSQSSRPQPPQLVPASLPITSGGPSGILKRLRETDDSGTEAPTPPRLSVAKVATMPSIRGALAMRLNSDALGDLVVLVDDRPEPVVIASKAAEIVVVDSTSDIVDGGTTSISDLNVNPGADGVISLREAITAANNTAGADTVNFHIPVDTDPGCDVGSGVCTIQPGGLGLPTITQPITIDGTSQPTFATTPVIEIDGSLASTDATGFAINVGNSTIRGLAINSFLTNSDIVMWGSGNNVIEGNFLGVDPSGTSNRTTTNSVHVYAISNNTIGGTTAAARNVISGNTNPAVALNAGASNNFVQGNFIGTDLTGTIALGNSGNDIVTLDSPNNTIGGTTAGAGNLVAGNLDSDFASIGLGFPASTGNLVQGNYVGTDVTGTIDLGGASIAIYIADGSANTIGGTTPAAANLISGGDSSGVGIATGGGNFVLGNLIGTQIDGVTPLPNGSHGVLIYSGAGNNTVGGRAAGAGNTIAFNGGSGVDLRGDAGVGNTIAGNSIFGNAELGINSCSDYDVDNLICNDMTAVTPNDPGDPDTGVNNLQNFPVLIAVLSSSTVDGSLSSIANSNFTIDFYASPSCDPSGHGEGETYLGSDIVATNAGGDATFSTSLALAAPDGWTVVATATDSDGSTSEFSECFGVPAELIFADGFGSGDTAPWSVAVP